MSQLMTLAEFRKSQQDAPATPAGTITAAEFDAAFNRCNGDRYNLVTLAALRDALQCSQDALQDAVRQNRSRYWLEPAEGRNGLSGAELAAAIDGCHNISRR